MYTSDGSVARPVQSAALHGPLDRFVRKHVARFHGPRLYAPKAGNVDYAETRGLRGSYLTGRRFSCIEPNMRDPQGAEGTRIFLKATWGLPCALPHLRDPRRFCGNAEWSGNAQKLADSPVGIKGFVAPVPIRVIRGAFWGERGLERRPQKRADAFCSSRRFVAPVPIRVIRGAFPRPAITQTS